MRLFHCLSSRSKVLRPPQPLGPSGPSSSSSSSFSSTCTSSSFTSSMLHSLTTIHLEMSYPLSFLCLLFYIFSLTVCTAHYSPAEISSNNAKSMPSWLRPGFGGGGGGANSRSFAHSFYDHNHQNENTILDASSSSTNNLNNRLQETNNRWPSSAQSSPDRYYYGLSAEKQQQLQQKGIRDRYLQFRDWLANPLQYLRHHTLLKQMLPTNGGKSSLVKQSAGEASAPSSTSPPPKASKVEEDDQLFGTVNRKPSLSDSSSLPVSASDSQTTAAASDSQISFIMKGKSEKGETQPGSEVSQKGPSYGVVRTGPNDLASDSRQRSRVRQSSRSRSNGNSRPKVVPVFDPFGNEMGQFSLDYGKKATAPVGMPRQEFTKDGIPLYGGDMGIIPGRFHDEPVDQPYAKFISSNRKFVGDEAPKRMRSSGNKSRISSGNNGNRRYGHVMRPM